MLCGILPFYFGKSGRRAIQIIAALVKTAFSFCHPELPTGGGPGKNINDGFNTGYRRKIAFCKKNKASYTTRSRFGTVKSPPLSLGLPLFEKNIIGNWS